LRQSRSLPAGDVFRARLILSLADGMTYREIEQLSASVPPTAASVVIRPPKAGFRAGRLPVR
jgi:hypothetical protein